MHAVGVWMLHEDIRVLWPVKLIKQDMWKLLKDRDAVTWLQYDDTETHVENIQPSQGRIFHIYIQGVQLELFDLDTGVKHGSMIWWLDS